MKDETIKKASEIVENIFNSEIFVYVRIEEPFEIWNYCDR